MRFLYTLTWCLALPLVLARLWWRGRREPGYREHIAERLGFYPDEQHRARPTIWVHAVSVGETRVAEPLIEAVLQEYPDHRVLLTHMTAAGRATGRALFAEHGPRLVQTYLPYDIGWLVRRFIRRYQPRLCVLMETEVWPNLIAQCNRLRLPILLANARLSERSLRKALRFRGLMGAAARGIDCVAAQTDADADRVRQLAVTNVHVTGSIKFDVTPPYSALEKGAFLRERFGERPVLLCASTREGEEELILDALSQTEMTNALVVIVPRHPQRFDEVARMIAGRGIAMERRSHLGSVAIGKETRILLGDSMGEMFAYYAACDVAFIGGSLLPLGGQNLIEACAVGKPVLIGPHTFNFGVFTEDAVAAGAAVRVIDATAMLREALHLLEDEDARRAMGPRALAFSQRHRGATVRTMALLKQLT